MLLSEHSERMPFVAIQCHQKSLRFRRPRGYRKRYLGDTNDSFFSRSDWLVLHRNCRGGVESLRSSEMFDLSQNGDLVECTLFFGSS